MKLINSHSTRIRSGLVASLAVPAACLAFAATASAAVPAKAEVECNGNGGGCHVEDLSNPTGCHVYVGYNDRIYAHNSACGYGTRTGPNGYVDYLGDF
jgi:hypothetical protein